MDGLRAPSFSSIQNSVFGKAELASRALPQIASKNGVALYFSRLGTPVYAHEKATLSRVAELIGEIRGIDSHNNQKRPYSDSIFFVPDDALMLDEALRLGILDENGLYGGVVPYPFVKTKVITHDLVSNASARPDGWSCSFARATQDVVLPGYTVFSVEDARNAAKHLLMLGAIRVKEPLGAGGYGHSIITTYNELAQFIEIYSPEKVATCGLVLETNLRPVLTRSVGQITIGGAMLAYYGTQRTAINNRGQAVYGGSDIICVRGGWDALERLPKDPEAQLAVAQARTYDLAAGKYPAFFASRRNYDVGQGIDGQGCWRSGVLEASWRSGGASTAELSAMLAFARDPTLQVVKASAVKVFGKLKKVPQGAIVHFHDNDPADGPIARYTNLTKGSLDQLTA